MSVSPTEQQSHEHQVGITNAQEKNPDATIADLTKRMNAHFAAKQYAEAARIALEITALSKDELRDTFAQHGVTVLRLDHEVFGIYAGMIEPSYDLGVEGKTADVLAAATEFGKKHAQEAVLVARKLEAGEADPAECLGLVIALQRPLTVEEAVKVVAVMQGSGFAGATFVPRRGEVLIYQTADLGMTREQFTKAADLVVARLQGVYSQATHTMQPYLVLMPKL